MVDGKNIVPRIVAEFEDTALLTVFGQRGLDLFFAPSVIAAELDLRTDRCLGEAQLFAGTRHAANPRHSPEIQQMMVVEPFHGASS